MQCSNIFKNKCVYVTKNIYECCLPEQTDSRESGSGENISAERVDQACQECGGYYEQAADSCSPPSPPY